ncbi:MAG: hypothetical protein JW793_10540 [Acidobacteria bacterium]|nr:hypothetical protein [Acidobacteriota bacterium]
MTANVGGFFKTLLVISAATLISACSDMRELNALNPIVVNSLEDLDSPASGTVTLRSALASASSGQGIRFDPSLDGGTIELSIIGESHTILKGEVMGMRTEPSGPVSYLVGYFDRDYGKSALYAVKDVHIDASDLPSGITIAWTGGAANSARVLAVYGDLTMKSVTITGGRSVAEDISTADPEDQPWTLARGGAVAVWGTARLTDCVLFDNYCEGDFDSSRDRGAFGGGLYADIVEMEGCIVSGNYILGGGASGGGVFSVGGREASGDTSTITRSSISGNAISALFAYGGGVYSDGGGIGNAGTLELINSTIAANVVEFPAPLSFGYWRGGGVYISNGSLRIQGCTIVENQVHGVPRTDSLGRRNLAGGVAATVGNAHAVDSMIIGHSIVSGNTVHEFMGNVYEHDIFTGSLMYFKSMGYNRIGEIDFSQILVPVGQRGWRSLNRKFYPMAGDEDGVDASEVLDLATGVVRSGTILSVGADPGNPAPLYYNPRGSALDRIPAGPYDITGSYMDYSIAFNTTNDFLSILLSRIEDHYALPGFAADFTSDFESFLNSVDIDDGIAGNQPYTDPDGDPILTLADTQWFGPAETWPKELPNYPYIEFWHRLDRNLRDENVPGMGAELLGSSAWDALFDSGPLNENPDIEIRKLPTAFFEVELQPLDQLNSLRPGNALGDIGAIEAP